VSLLAKDELMNLALRKNLFFPSAEIYPNAPSGFWEFGPVGSRVRRKVLEVWRKNLVDKEGFLEITGSIILPEQVFDASGHLKSFSDPIVRCSKCNSLHRADELIQDTISEIVPESLSTTELASLIEKHKVKCPKCGNSSLGEVKKFNMMMKVDIGATGDSPCYLRPETCQSIFLDFLRIYKSGRQNLPLGIAQEGKSFRNEIAPRNTLLRERELGQMEAEVFFNPDRINETEKWDDVRDYKLNLMLLGKETKAVSCSEAAEKGIVSGKLIAYLLARTQQLYSAYGIPVERMRFRELDKDERAFYAKETWDFEVETSLGWIELVACNYRTDYDLRGHSTVSKKDLSVTDDGKKFIPHVFEISAGIDRTFYVTLELAYRKEKRGAEERVFLDLVPDMAPYFVAVFPLVKKDGLAEKAKALQEGLAASGFEVIFDEKASIGRRYARTDEIGVPYAVTVDYDTMKDNTVTLRERNSMEQKRVSIDTLPEILLNLKLGKKAFTGI
jgi:glycyl-tRNA synthetase